MLLRRSTIVRSLTGYLVAVHIVLLSTSLERVEGIKCVCTSKACKETEVDSCRTRFFCYTEFILTTGPKLVESTTTRGCTEGATPLLCETKPWFMGSRSVNVVDPSVSPRALVPWPRLKCCDSHDYCNAEDSEDEEDASMWMREQMAQMDRARSTMNRGTSDNSASSDDAMLTVQPDGKYEDPEKSTDRILRNRVRALHIATLVLAVAALISVLASCYVVTRWFLEEWSFFWSKEQEEEGRPS